MHECDRQTTERQTDHATEKCVGIGGIVGHLQLSVCLQARGGAILALFHKMCPGKILIRPKADI